MRLGAIQSNYIPWRGYFDFIQSVDLFVFYDDVQYTKGDWRNRNKIRSNSDSTLWLTVPVLHKHLDQLILETKIDYTKSWQRTHLKTFRANYFNAPFFQTAFDLFELGLSKKHNSISELNIFLIEKLNQFLEIRTPCRLSSEYNLRGQRTERLIDLMHKTKATTYLSGPSAKAYLEEDVFKSDHFNLEFKTYDYSPYFQIHGAFDGFVSVLDLVANLGPNAKSFLKSNSQAKDMI